MAEKSKSESGSVEEKKRMIPLNKISRVKSELANVSLQSMFSNPAVMMINERVVFIKLLFRWTSSIWQSLLWDTIIFLCLYYLIRLSLIFIWGGVEDPQLTQSYKTAEKVRTFYKKISDATKQISSLMPITFLLGFFVSTVLSRWWSFASNFPSLSSTAVIIQTCVRSRNQSLAETTWNLKHAFARYLNLAFIFSMRNFSFAVQDRFMPTRLKKRNFRNLAVQQEPPRVREILQTINKDPVIVATYGQLVTEDEIKYFEDLVIASEEPWIPLRWCTELTAKAGELKCLFDDQSYRMMIEAINSFRGSLGMISAICKFNIPLVYIQAIIIVVYAYVLNELFDPDFITDPKQELLPSFDRLMPFVALIKFFLFMGWFKIGLSLINPLREDQSHFPTLEMVDYNLRFLSKFTLTKSDILPPSMLLQGEDLKRALKNDAHEILTNVLKEGISEHVKIDISNNEHI